MPLNPVKSTDEGNWLHFNSQSGGKSSVCDAAGRRDYESESADRIGGWGDWGGAETHQPGSFGLWIEIYSFGRAASGKNGFPSHHPGYY